MEEIKQKFQKLIEGNITQLISLNNMCCKYVNFIHIKNKWSEFSCRWKCCENNCINTNNPVGNCIKGNGCVNLINDENIKYLVGKSGCDKRVVVYTENSFKKPQNCLNYSLYYFEIKCKFEGKLNNYGKYMVIGLKTLSTNKVIIYFANNSTIYNEKFEGFKLSKLYFKNNDIFGCGLVYPPTDKLNEEFPYVFFTQNGKQIGKGVLLKDNFELYKPYVALSCCSVEANFGNNLTSKPFKYDISNHFINKDFY
uniref:Uncharacterized protein n=1 Tax=Meloidogyne enterolobii TaxID=390850 RepID=A0A6V7VCS1_MELEN|nr:unnamed protein product [Meloidogyne enterolobii]